MTDEIDIRTQALDQAIKWGSTRQMRFGSKYLSCVVIAFERYIKSGELWDAEIEPRLEEKVVKE